MSVSNREVAQFFFAFLIIIATMALTLACTDDDGTTRVLSDMGYRDIQTQGYAAFRCGQDDTFATGFRATAPSGRTITGTVCKGLLKGSTVRID